jgi:hypothetical protein
MYTDSRNIADCDDSKSGNRCRYVRQNEERGGEGVMATQSNDFRNHDRNRGKNRPADFMAAADPATSA